MKLKYKGTGFEVEIKKYTNCLVRVTIYNPNTKKELTRTVPGTELAELITAPEKDYYKAIDKDGRLRA